MDTKTMTIGQYLETFGEERGEGSSVTVVYDSRYDHELCDYHVIRIERDYEGIVALCDSNTCPREIGDEADMTLETAADTVRGVLSCWGYRGLAVIDADALYLRVDVAELEHETDEEE